MVLPTTSRPDADVRCEAYVPVERMWTKTHEHYGCDATTTTEN